MKAEWNQIIRKTKEIQKKCIWNDFWPRAQQPPPHVLAYLRARVQKIEPLLNPNGWMRNSQRWKKIITNGFLYCKLNSQKHSFWEYEWNRTRTGQWKIVANEICTAEIGELSPVKNSYWVIHATEKAQKKLEWKIFGWSNVPEKTNWLYSPILEK